MYSLKNSILIITWFCLSYCLNTCISLEFVYPGRAKSERDLSTCQPNEVCSIVHKRFWFSNEVERFCRCDSQECSSSWSDQSDDRTMMINNRAQMKFCEPVTKLPNCLENTTHFLHVINQTQSETFNTTTIESYKITSRAECYCPNHHTWVSHAYQRNESTLSWTSYRCSELPKCNPRDFCGFERHDFYSNYYKCSCPMGYLCVRENESTSLVNEIFYYGYAFKTYCTLFSLPKEFNDMQ